MSIVAAPGATFYPSVDWNATGATLGVRLRRVTDGVDLIARSTVGISESPAGSGIYVLTAGMTAPTTAGQIYLVEWDDTVDFVAEDLTVTYSAAGASVPLATDLCTVSDVREYLQKGVSELAHDDIIQTFITDASRILEAYAMRDFAERLATTRTFRVDGCLVDLNPHDLRTATTVTLDPNGTPSVLAAADYKLMPSGASLLGTYYQMRLRGSLSTSSSTLTEFGFGEISILGTWGPAAVPVDVRHATVITVGLWVRREVAARGSLNPDYELDGVDLRPLAMPGAAMRILAPYTRMVLV